MPPISESPIAKRSSDCLQLFEHLNVLLDDKTMDHLISPAVCLDELGRFRMWANNIGAFLSVDHRNSLDFRLREASKVGCRIVEFLDDLAEALTDGSSILSGDRPNRVMVVSSSSSSDLDLEQTEFSEIFGIVKDTITSLMQTSIIIRNATPRDRYIKAQSSAKNPFLEFFDIAHVGNKFPKIDSEGRDWLKRRLGKAITQRRQYLKYCREHHDKFSGRVQDLEVSSEGRNTFHDIAPEPKSECKGGSIKSAPASALAPTDASTLHPSRFELVRGMVRSDTEDISDSYSQTSYATSVHDDASQSKLYAPSLKDITHTFPFECPYCWTLQEFTTEKSWRKHVFTDLRPYVCTFERCDLRLFADRHTWFNHELECHRSEWCCPFCSGYSFGSETRLSAHMRDEHPQFSSPIQLPALVKASRRSVDQIPAKACPLCHWDVTLKDLNPRTPSDEILVVTLEQFRRHLGAHMEQLALFALPRSYEDEELSAGTNEAAAMDHSDSESRHLSRTDSVSWKTASSRGATLDNAIPDISTRIVPNIGVHWRDVYPWSQKPLDMSAHTLIIDDYMSIPPFPRMDAATSQVCSNKGDLYVHGGELTESHPGTHELWTIDANETSTCSPVATNPPGPGLRDRHAALLVDNTFIVFGGFMRDTPSWMVDDSLSAGMMDDSLYLLNLSTKLWSKVVAHTRPSGRIGHTLSLLGTVILVFGGYEDKHGELSNDLYAFDLDHLQRSPNDASWKILLPNESRPNIPPARRGHTMVSWDRNLYLFGGLNGHFFYSDVWEYDSLENQWAQLNCEGVIPQSRHRHSAAVVNGVMYVFGGQNSNKEILGDLTAFVISSRRWFTFGDIGPSPSPRVGHSMCVYNEKILVFGGFGPNGPYTGRPGTYSRDIDEDLTSIYSLDTSKIRFPSLDVLGNGLNSV